LLEIELITAIAADSSGLISSRNAKKYGTYL